MDFDSSDKEQKMFLTERGVAFLKEWRSQDQFVEAHTSGSTGAPKTIRLPKCDMIASAEATNRFFGITSDSILACPLSADYIAGKMMIVRAAVAGCRLFMVEPSNNLGDGINRIIDQEGRIDLLPIVPSQCDSVINDVNVARVGHIIVGGAPIPSAKEDALAKLACEIWATYGMTETCSHVAVRHIGSKEYRAMPGVSFSTESKSLLVIDAPAYSFKRLRTNDVVSLVDSHHFIWLGRADNVVNSGGLKIYPEQVERMLEPYIQVPFYLKGEEDSKWGTRLVMVAQCDPSEVPELLEICRRWLPSHSVPKNIYSVAELPRTSNGKLRRL